MHSLFYKHVISHLPDKWIEKSGGTYYKIASYISSASMIDLPVKLVGIEFPNPMGMPAGWIDEPGKLQTVHRLGVGIPTIKTITVHKKQGNPYPRIIREGDSMINSLGLPNKGIDWWVSNFSKPDYPTIVSIKGNNFKEWQELIEKSEGFSDIIELNLSCPNVGDGVIDLKSSEAIIQDISSIIKKKVFLKLSPEFSAEQNLQLIDKIRSDIDGITAINTVPVTHEKLGNPSKAGGRSGPAIFNLLEKQLTTLRKEYTTMNELPILATGGINRPEQAWKILTEYKSLPMGLTAFLTNGPRYYSQIVQYIKEQLNKTEDKLEDIMN